MRKWPVRVHREGALPLRQRHLIHRRRVRDAGIGDHHVEPAIGEHDLLQGARTAASLVTSSPSPSARPLPCAAITSSATLRAPAASTSVTTTWAPSAASRSATARPMPPPPR